MQELVQEKLRISSVVEHGDPVESPRFSLIVPLYRRVDYLELQLAEFADDPDFEHVDLVYVLDSPEQEEEVRHVSAHLFPIYRRPFRVAVLEQNVGFAGANNAGASIARAPLLLLMNSDVLPTATGWLERMRSFYESKDSIGALGPKLLYDDDSIQHAGMYYYRPPGSPYWQDAHFFKGLHSTFPDANVARPTPVVSGACMMIAKELYDKTGLRGIHVRGDYEDNDLCLRLLEAGLQNWYTPDAELYHLEAQSYSGDSRMRANRYNMWLHNRLWGERIDELMRRPEAWRLPSR
jgi:GT2 family glycosyltransferase